MLMRREHERMTGAVSAVLGGIFVIAGLAHATDGFTDNEVHALPSAIIGIVAGVALLVAAFGMLTNRFWGFRVGIGAHVLAIATVLLFVFSISAGYGDGRPSLALPGVMLVMLVLSAVALWRSRPRNPLKRAGHEMAAKLY